MIKGAEIFLGCHKTAYILFNSADTKKIINVAAFFTSNMHTHKTSQFDNGLDSLSNDVSHPLVSNPILELQAKNLRKIAIFGANLLLESELLWRHQTIDDVMIHMGERGSEPPTHMGTHRDSFMYPFAKIRINLFLTSVPKLLQMTVKQFFCKKTGHDFRSRNFNDNPMPLSFGIPRMLRESVMIFCSS